MLFLLACFPFATLVSQIFQAISLVCKAFKSHTWWIGIDGANDGNDNNSNETQQQFITLLLRQSGENGFGVFL